MNFFLTCILFFVTLTVSASADPKELRLAHFMSPEHHFHTDVFVPWSEQLKTVSAGELSITIFPAGELGAGPIEQYSRAVDGVADISFIVQGYTPGEIFPLSLLVEQPGAIQDIWNTTEALIRASDLIASEYQRVKLLAAWSSPPAVLFTRNTPVASINDVVGMKVRVGTKGAAELVESWGAVPIFMPATDVYTAMQTGVVDAVLIDASSANAFKLTEVAKYMISGFESVPAVFALVMNRDRYEILSDVQKAALDSISYEPLSRQAGLAATNATRGAMTRFEGTGGRSHILLSPEQTNGFNKAADQVLQSRIRHLEALGLQPREVLGEMRGQ